MSDADKIVDGFRTALHELLVPEFKALRAAFRSAHQPEVESRREKHDERFARIFDAMLQFGKTQQVILNRLDYADQISALQLEVERLKHHVKLPQSQGVE